MNRTLFLLLLGLLVSLQTFAHNGNDGWVTAKSYQLWTNTYGSKEIRVVPNDGVYNPQGCSDPDSYMVSTAHADSVQQRIYSSLLAAKLAGQSVRLNIDSSACQGSKPRILTVVIL